MLSLPILCILQYSLPVLLYPSHTAYTTFLQTVRHTSGTDALALLDSESEDIEGIIATGVRADSEVESTASLSSAAIGAEGGGGGGGERGGRETDKSGEGEQQPHLTSARYIYVLPIILYIFDLTFSFVLYSTHISGHWIKEHTNYLQHMHYLDIGKSAFVM